MWTDDPGSAHIEHRIITGRNVPLRGTDNGPSRCVEVLMQVPKVVSVEVGRSGLTTVGEPVWARYDPPWKPWFLRRNEVLLEIDG